jgi:hypothetical protein
MFVNILKIIKISMFEFSFRSQKLRLTARPDDEFITFPLTDDAQTQDSPDINLQA